MKKILLTAVNGFVLILSCGSFFIGLLVAFFGSRADIAVSEQSVCLWGGIGLAVTGFATIFCTVDEERFQKNIIALVILQLALHGVITQWGL